MVDFKKEIIKILNKDIKDPNLEIPQNKEFGDYSLPCFEIAKEQKKNPVEIAKLIGNKLKANKYITKIKVIGPYVNFYINKNILAETTIKEILQKKEKYGSKLIGKEKVMIEFSQANTHKAFHIGHVRGTSLGESISRIFEFFGNNVTRVNYQGDTGMHVAKWIWCYLNYHKNEKIVSNEKWIASIYIEAVKRLKENPDLQIQVDEINKKLDSKKDKKLNDLWKKTRKPSLDSFNIIYSDLNTKFDKYFFESEMEKRGKEIAQMLVKKKIAEISDGAIIINLKKYNLGVWVLLRKDGTVLYSAKDIALAEKKFNDFKITKSIYVVGHEQRLHIHQLFKTLELMKFKQAKNCVYVPVNLVKLPTGRMSSRTGENIIYSSFKKEILDYTKNEIKKREKNPKDLDKRALAISMASLKYSMLKLDINKEIVFDKENALKFEGDTGAYLLYTYARAKSILRNAKTSKKSINLKEINEIEEKLISELSNFKEVSLNAYKNISPNLIANYAYSISQRFNEFYHNSKVIGSENEEFRLALVESFSIILKNSLDLLGIEVIEKM